MFSERELARYARTLPVIGRDGQEQLKSSRVLIVGAGGLGSSAALHLTAAGIGTLGILDFDTVQESNLPRQLLHFTCDVGVPKTRSAKETLERLNPHTVLQMHQERLTAENAVSRLNNYDIVLDCSDSLETKYLLNRSCRALGKPLVFGAAVGTEGQLAVFLPGGPCLACLIRSPRAPSCSSEGVFPTVPGTIGTLQAGEALKLALGMPPLKGLLTFDARKTEFRNFTFAQNPACRVCGKNKNTEAQEFFMTADEVSCQELKTLLATGSVQLIDVREQREWDAGHIPGAQHIPMPRLKDRLRELPKNKPIVTYCQSGIRSLEAARFLHARGYKAHSLKGGIEAWSVK